MRGGEVLQLKIWTHRFYTPPFIQPVQSHKFSPSQRQFTKISVATGEMVFSVKKSRIRRTSETSYRPRATFILDDSHIKSDNSAPSQWLAACMLLGTRVRGKRGGG